MDYTDQNPLSPFQQYPLSACILDVLMTLQINPIPIMGHGTVKGKPEERVAQLALYMIENKQTIRGAAKALGISKSTVHRVQ
ncbi:MAG: sporulation transcriptional regulator SpoIIID [Acetanaerobacterium sp.]